MLTLAAGIVLAAVPCVAAEPFSEHGNPLITNHSMRDYLAHNQVWGAVQDARGVLYFGNRDVILEFDGERWRQIPVPGGLFIRGLDIDESGTIWVGATDEMGFLEPDESGRLRYVSLMQHVPEADRFPGALWGVDATPQGIFFEATHRVYRWHAGKFTIWHRDSPRSIFISHLGNAMHLFERTVGLSRLEGDAWVLVSDESFFKDIAVFRSFEEADGSWMLVTADKGLYRYRGGAVEPVTTLADEFIKSGDLYDARRLRDGSLALGTLLNGLVVLRPDGSVETVVDVDAGLQDNSIKHILEGRDGGLWLSLGNGVAHVQRGAYTLFDARRGLQPNTLHQIMRHRDRLYVAGNLGLFELAPGTALDGGPTMKLIDGIPGRVMGLVSHESGLVVAHRRNPLLYDGASVKPIGGAYGTVHHLYRSPIDPDRVFVGTSSGVNAMRWQGGAWMDEGAIPGIDDDVRDMAQTADGILWAGTPSRGILRIELGNAGRGPIASARVTRYTAGSGLPENLGWTSAHLTDEGEVFFRTASGLITFDPAAGRFQPFAKFGKRFCDGTYLVSRMVWDTGLKNIWASVYPLAEDQYSSPWGRGLFGRAVPDGRGDFAWSILPPDLFSPIANLSAMLLERDERGRPVLWVGANAGLVRVEIDRLPESRPPPEVLVREVTTAEGRTLFAGAGSTPTAGVTVPYADNGLRITFAAPYHGPARSVLYQSRLDGVDRDWSHPSRETQRDYTSLFEGGYRFHVRAVDAGDQAGPEAVFEFRVRPPVYRTAAAYSAYGVLAVLAVFGIVRWRLAALRRENERLENLIAERTEDLRLARDEADQANRAKSTFLANMSHELRTPLNGILGYTQILRRDPDLTPENRKRVDVLQASGEHLLRLINEVLDLSKIEAGRIELHPAPVRLRGIIDAVRLAFAPRIEEKGLAFECRIDPGVPETVVADEQKLSQVLFNLLGNAVKFTERGCVTLSVTAQTAGVRFEVRDTGVGIAPDEQAMVFQPFQQAATHPLQEDGTGLGLTICSRIVALMGGRLEVESEPGQGSRFWFEVDLAETRSGPLPAATSADAVPRGYASPRRHVMVVDDVAINRTIVREMLQPLGFEVTEAASGRECLAAVEAAAPDLILLDLRMAPMSGAEVLARLRGTETGRAIKVVAFSASTIGFGREDAVAMGCDDYLPKPFQEKELYAVLQRQLDLAWTFAKSDASSDLAPAKERAIRVPRAAVERLLAAAQTGNIRELKRVLAAIRDEQGSGDPILDEVEKFGDAFAMASIRALLRARLEDHPESHQQ